MARKAPWPLTLLCRDHDGYLSLSRLLTRAWMEGHRADGVAIAPGMAARRTAKACSPSPAASSLAGRLAAGGRHDLAEQHLADWQRSFGENLHLELTRTQRDGEDAFNAFALHAAAARGLPVVASNDVRFLRPRRLRRARGARVHFHRPRAGRSQAPARLQRPSST